MLKTALSFAVAAPLVTSCRPGTREDYSRSGPAQPSAVVPQIVQVQLSEA